MEEMNKYPAEEFFLKNYEMEHVFRSVKRTDYLFLYYIKHCQEDSVLENGVYLAELAEAMNLPMPDISKAIHKLQDKGYVTWKTDSGKERTFVKLTGKAVDMMNEQKIMLSQYYTEIQNTIEPKDLEITMQTMKKISEIIKSGENQFRS